MYYGFVHRSLIFFLSFQIEERGIPCTTLSKAFYTNQGVYIIVLLIYVYLNGSIECSTALGGGCAWPRSLKERRRIRVLKSKMCQELRSVAAAKERKLEMEARQVKSVLLEVNEEVNVVAVHLCYIYKENTLSSYAKHKYFFVYIT